eukprot:TRINITY_DN14565_c0_g1_i1.p1 TRINITY_DN14565_c0_g1~~TRINITY_DN14565_c0_g1_i1.p1  ORF type:complete len:1588 (-),score=590.08 TRINITY_DN14565_c0_g1_i1:93-4856(-)
MDSSGNQEKGDENQLNVSQESQESDVSKSEETSSSDVNTSSSKSVSDSQSDSSKSELNSSKSDLNSSLDKSLNVSKDAVDEEEMMVKNVFTVNSSMEKSSPFHGFSSQDDVAAGEDVSDEANKELKQQMFADFGIDNDDSEEETENSDCETETVKNDEDTVNKKDEDTVNRKDLETEKEKDDEAENEKDEETENEKDEEAANEKDVDTAMSSGKKANEVGQIEEATDQKTKKFTEDFRDETMDDEESFKGTEGKEEVATSNIEDTNQIPDAMEVDGDIKNEMEGDGDIIKGEDKIEEVEKTDFQGASKPQESEEVDDEPEQVPEVVSNKTNISPVAPEETEGSNIDDETCKEPTKDSNPSPDTENEIISPIKLGKSSPIKCSPKKVHFSPDLESVRKESPPRPLIADIPLLEEFQDHLIPPNIESTPKVKKSKEKISPLRLKIKFGKDKTGTITHGKIKSKGNYSSDDEQKNPRILEMVNQPLLGETSTESYHLPTNPDDSFHGFPGSSVPDWVCDNFTEVDLKSHFHIKPTVFVSISSKKSQNKQQPAVPKAETPVSVKIKTPEPPVIETPKPEKTDQPEIPKLIIAVPSHTLEQSTPLSSKKERKRGDKNLNYIKPLYDGWIRELVWRTPADAKKSDADVFYYPPDPPGQRKLKFKSPNELEGYLITSASMYPINFFTFKKEPINGPEGMEIIRNFSYTLEKASSGSISSPESPQNDTLGKRVSKPPEKLIIENLEPETPSRASKRVIKPPDKLELDYTPATKVARVEVPEQPAPVPVQAPTPTPQPTERNRVKSTDIETEAERQESPSKLPEKGTLKLKMFSKMNVKNQLTGSDSSRNNSEAEDNDIVVLDENVPQKVEIPIPSGMTITKVKKSTSDTINLPGLPTIGPPPMSYGPSSTSLASSISITPLSNRPVTMNLAPIPLEPVKPSPKIIRPSKPTLLPCSIHCPGVSGFPSLSCTSCHCLFHPKCVGLPPSLGSSSHHEFYCNDCQPTNSASTPANPIMQPEKPKQLTPHTPGVPVAPLKPVNIDIATKKVEQVVPKSQEIKKVDTSKSKENQKPLKAKPPAPPRPFEGQTMINIAGKKFLVIPHPAQVNIESPPPSPPPTARATPGFPSNSNNSNSHSNSTADKPANEKLDVLLKPVENYPKMPCFEVELTPDGKYLLTAKDNNTKNLFGESSHKPQAVITHTPMPSWGNSFSRNVSGGYHGMMEVFKYLSVKERVQAACVCKLWRDIAFHQVLWKTVSLKNTRVFDWRGFAKFFNQTKSGHLDVRKMLFVKDREATWIEIISIAPEFLMLKKLELPKLSGSVLTDLMSACPRLEAVHAPLTTPPLNINVFSKMTQLKELKLKSSAGTMLRINQGISGLSNLAPRLTQLSLLTMEGLQQKDFDVFGTLIHLELLEIGECHNAPANIFKTLSDLSKLQRLRMEKGSVGENVSKLANAPRLRDLELIDFQILNGFRDGLSVIKNIQKLLIIPTYKNEVAKINTEIVEGVTKEMNQLSSFYLGVTNEWLEAMALAMGSSKVHKTGGEKECFPLSRGGQVEHISLPALYRLVCREMPGCKVKVLKMSAQATCKQFIANLDQS